MLSHGIYSQMMKITDFVLILEIKIYFHYNFIFFFLLIFFGAFLFISSRIITAKQESVIGTIATYLTNEQKKWNKTLGNFAVFVILISTVMTAGTWSHKTHLSYSLCVFVSDFLFGFILTVNSFLFVVRSSDESLDSSWMNLHKKENQNNVIILAIYNWRPKTWRNYLINKPNTF